MEPEKDSTSSSQKPSLLRGLLGTLIVVSAFVASFWSKFKTPIKKSAESIHPQDSTNNNSAQTSPPLPLTVRIESYPPPPVTKKEQAEQSEERFLRRLNSIATVLTAIFAAGLLCVTARYVRYTYNMWKEMQEQTAIQRNIFNGTNRPWVDLSIESVITPEQPRGTPSDDIKMPLKFRIKLRNYGNSPALNLLADLGAIQHHIPREWPSQKDTCMANKIEKTQSGDAVFPGTDGVVFLEKEVRIRLNAINWVTACLSYKDVSRETTHHTALLFIGLNKSGEPISPIEKLELRERTID